MQLHYRKLGEGRPLIILHGLFGSSDNWLTLGKKFAENSFSVYLVDARNHGRSPHSDEFSYESMSNDVFELITSIQSTGVANATATFLLGHSMGGKAAMLCALNHPGIISKFIVVDIAPKKYRDTNSEISKNLLSLKLNEINNRKEADEKLAEKIKDFATRQFLLKNLFRDEVGKFRWRLNLEVIHKNLMLMNEETISGNTFEKPVFFVRGAKSDYVKEDDITAIKKLFPNSEIKTAPNAGHWVHADNPEWLLNNSMQFLLNE